MKTILFLANGTSIHSFKWISFFSKKYNIFWLSTDGFEESFIKDGNIIYVDCKISRLKLLNILFGLVKFLYLLIKFEISLIHIHYLGYHSILASFVKKTPVFLTAWGSDIVFALNSTLKKNFLKHYLNKAKVITCDSHHMQQKMNSIIGKENKVNIINFGIDTSFFIKIEKNKLLINTLGTSSNNIIISTRNHEDVYDIKTLISSINLVKKEFPSVLCIIAGTGSKTHELERQVEEDNLVKNVKFVGRLSNENIRDYLSISSLYVSTSLSDGGIAASTAEAMSSEVPCIVTDVADNSKWVINLHSGLLVEPGNSIQLSSAIKIIFSDSSFGQQIAKNARKIIIDNNDYENEMDKMNNLYQSILNEI